MNVRWSTRYAKEIPVKLLSYLAKTEAFPEPCMLEDLAKTPENEEKLQKKILNRY